MCWSSFKGSFLKESCFGKKLCLFKFLRASLIFMCIKNKRLLTSTAEIRNIPIHFLIFWSTMQWCMFLSILLFTVCLCQILEEEVEGAENPTVLCNLKWISANEKGKSTNLCEIFSKETFLQIFTKAFFYWSTENYYPILVNHWSLMSLIVVTSLKST